MRGRCAATAAVDCRPRIYGVSGFAIGAAVLAGSACTCISCFRKEWLCQFLNEDSPFDASTDEKLSGQHKN